MNDYVVVSLGFFQALLDIDVVRRAIHQFRIRHQRRGLGQPGGIPKAGYFASRLITGSGASVETIKTGWGKEKCFAHSFLDCLNQDHLDHSGAGDLFEDPEWRFLRRNHVLDGEVKGLFELVLAGIGRMRSLVGKNHPGGAGRKVEWSLGRIVLVILVSFHAVMQLQHVVIV